MKKTNFKIIDSSDLQDPEVLAMLQAFYSRSPMPIEERLATFADDTEGTKTEKIRNALKTYYVDYGHASIGECGGCTVFIENVSMLAAKAIQDHPLYVGQECSTRYIDFSEQHFFTPCSVSVPEKNTQNDWRRLYLDVLPLAKAWARSTYSPDLVLSGRIEASKREAAHERTCNAIAFDVCRSLLPAGASTSLAWTANFRVFNDHLRWLSHHPLLEVREIASSLYAQLAERFTKSFKQEELNCHEEIESISLAYAHSFDHKDRFPELSVEHHIWGKQGHLQPNAASFATQRYRHQSDNKVSFEIKGLLDFGSFRDLARHRPGMNRNALVTTEYGFNKFYKKAFLAMDSEIMLRVYTILEEPYLQDMDIVEKQYLLPMGMNVGFHVQWSLGQLRYVSRLRSKTSVHPTLRELIWDVTREVKTQLPQVEPLLEVDYSKHYEASDRGEQTFKKVTPV